MTALTFLVSGTLWLAAYSLFGQPLIIVVATSLSVTSLIGVYSDLRKIGRAKRDEDHDHTIGLQRLEGYEVGR